MEFRDLYRAIFACVFNYEIIISELRSHCLLLPRGLSSAEEMLGKEVGREREGETEK